MFLSIKRTLAYFDQFSHPLTAEELYTFLWEPPYKIAWPFFLELLEMAVAEGHCSCTCAYYFLPGCDRFVEERRHRLILVEKKLALARGAARLMGIMPFVRGIFVCNTVAAGWPTAESDIDVLVVVKTGRLWLTRFLVTLSTSFFNVRRGKKNIADRVCLSFYVTDTHLNLDEVRIARPDIYLVYWIQQLVPIFDEAEFLAAILAANTWTKEYLPNTPSNPQFLPQKIIVLNRVERLLKHGLEKILEGKIGIWLERVSRVGQCARIERQPHNSPPAVIISDAMLKFHEADRRAEYQNEWLKRMGNYQI